MFLLLEVEEGRWWRRDLKGASGGGGFRSRVCEWGPGQEVGPLRKRSRYREAYETVSGRDGGGGAVGRWMCRLGGRDIYISCRYGLIK